MPVDEALGEVFKKHGSLIGGVIIGAVAGWFVAAQAMKSEVEAYKQSAAYDTEIKKTAEKALTDAEKARDDKQTIIDQLRGQIESMVPRADLNHARDELRQYTEALPTLDARDRIFQAAQNWCPWARGRGPCFDVKEVKFDTLDRPTISIESGVWSSPITLSSVYNRPIRREEFVWSGKQYDLVLDTDSDSDHNFMLKIEAHRP